MSPSLRPLATDDAEAGAALILRCFAVAAERAGDEVPEVPAERRRLFAQRMANFVRTDPDGSWAAEDGEGLAGLSVAIRRGPLWGLALLFVRPELQGEGLGGRLLERARRTADGAVVEIIESSEDVRAMRRYAGLGLTLHPAMALTGAPDRSRLPAEDGTRDGTADDLDLVEVVDAALRGAGATRTPDVADLLEAGAELVVADAGPSRRGFAVRSSGRPVCLGATDDATARRLLLAALARAEEGSTIEIEGVTAAQGWAFATALEVGMGLRPSGPMFLRGWPQLPGPYLPSGVYF